MKLHLNPKLFNRLINLTAEYKNLSYEAIIKDYYIVKILYDLSLSEYAEDCIFKGVLKTKASFVAYRYS